MKKYLHCSEFYGQACEYLLAMAQRYANEFSGCTKVTVGSVIVEDVFTSSLSIYGANKSIPDHCKSSGCLRVEKYGENSKLHRNPDDCRAIHSEIDAISSAAKHGVSLKGKTIIVTRYPCEACARAIASSGIKRVIYGRKQEISDLTKQIFDFAGVSAIHIPEWDYDDEEN